MEELVRPALIEHFEAYTKNSMDKTNTPIYGQIEKRHGIPENVDIVLRPEFCSEKARERESVLGQLRKWDKYHPARREDEGSTSCYWGPNALTTPVFSLSETK